MNMLDAAHDWLNNQRKQYLSTEVEYRHYGVDSVALTVSATRGSSIFRSENEYGITVRVHSMDFLISAADLNFIPSKGDEIICAGKKYEVLAPNNEPVWRWSGNENTTMRIHCKETGEVSNG